MPFTLEQIEAFLTNAFQKFHGYVTMDTIRASPNYDLITGYLCGAHSSFQQYQQHHADHYWSPLPLLLEQIDPPGEKDQLILDLVQHPDLGPFLQHSFSNWLIQYMFDHPTKPVFDAVKLQFQKIGLNDVDLFKLLVFSTIPESLKEEWPKHEPLQSFLKEIVYRNKGLISPSGNFFSNTNWSFQYFTLLDEVRPELAEKYLEALFQSNGNWAIPYLVDYKEGKYLKMLLATMQHITPHGNDYGSKLGAAYGLYLTDSSRFQPILLEMSRVYLQKVTPWLNANNWEGSIMLPEFASFPYSANSFTAVALYFVLLHHKNEGIAFAEDWIREKKFIPEGVAYVLYHTLQHDALPLLQQLAVYEPGGVPTMRAALQLLEKAFEPEKYIPVLYKGIGVKTKQVRLECARMLVKLDPEVEARAIPLLQHKKADTRLSAAIILGMLRSETALKAIAEAIDTEVNDDARDVLLEAVDHTLSAAVTPEGLNTIITAARNRGKLGNIKGTEGIEAALPPLYMADGNPAEQDMVRFLLYRMQRVKTMRSDKEARLLIALTDKQRNAPFALALVQYFIKNGAQPGEKYLIATAALLGNDTIVDHLKTLTNKWIEESRYKMAEYGVSALALQGSDKALRWVEWYSRQYRNKKKNVGAAAAAALENAATELGISANELGDRIVPDFGFEGLFFPFDANGETYRAFIDSDFKIAVLDERNKILKTPPSYAPLETKEKLKAIGKEIKDVVKAQSPRLEYYLVVQRKWTFSKWSVFFLENPVMFIYATRLLWGCFDENSELQSCFYCSDDTSLLNAEEEETTIPEDAIIGIVHPVQLEQPALQQWKQLFYKNDIAPIFPQLERKTVLVPEHDLSKRIIRTFEGIRRKEGAIRSTLERSGWRKGATGDGGMVEAFHLPYPEKGIEAVLEVEGVGAGFGWGLEEKTGRLYLLDLSKKESTWFTPPQNDHDDKLVPLNQAPPIFLSEVFAAVESIKTAASG